jgi:hypothetical protein
MFVTTSGRTNDQMIKTAMRIADELMVSYIPRDKRSVVSLQERIADDCLVIGKNRLELYPIGEQEPFFFHPNSAMLRIKRLLKGERDPFIEASQLKEGMSIIDCTLGLASDSIVASFVVGETGKVFGIDASQCLSFVVKDGLEKWDSGLVEMNKAMERIVIHQGYSLDYLLSQKENSVDCVYFDPMFEESILESDGIKALGKFAIYDDLTESMINEALRVARKRVVLKDHFRSERFGKYGFQVFRRKSAKFHFGVIEISGKK